MATGPDTHLRPRPSARHPRRAVALVVAVLLIALSAACGGGGDDAASDDSGASATSTTPEDAVDLGDRVVVVGEEDLLADVLALGIEPVAATATVAEAGFQGLDEYDTDGIEVLPQTDLSVDALFAQEPTTVITLQFWIDQIDPTLADDLAGQTQLLVVPDALPSDEAIVALGELVGRQDRAEAIVEDLAAAQQEAGGAVADDCSVTVAAIYPGPSPAVFVDGPWVIPSSLIDAGCDLAPDPDGLDVDANGRVYLSTERLDLMSGPVLILLQAPAVDGDTAALDELQQDRVWQTLPAVQADAVHVVDRLGYPGATGHIRFLREIPDLIG